MTRQLTVRACLMGMILGGLLCLSNLYIALKIGSSLGVPIIAGILAYAIFSMLANFGWIKTEFGMLENNAMQSVASAAGFMTGGGTVAAIGALMLLTGKPMDPWAMFCWITTVAFLGVVMAIPMKQQMINIEQLAFPSGQAAAETIRALHEHSGKGAKEKARLLSYSGLVGAVLSFFRDAHAKWIPFNIPERIQFPFLTIAGRPAIDFTIAFNSSLVMIGAGAIMGFRAAWSILLGGLINFGILAPWLFEHGIITKLGYRNIIGWSIWFGASCIMTSGLLSFAFQWRTVGRAIGSIFAVFHGNKSSSDDGEVPMSWFLIGVAILSPIVIFLEHYLFAIKIWMGALSVAMSFVVAIVACRATGETDTVPTGSLGKITQLTFGVLDPSNVVTNTMTSALTAGTGLHSADLLVDLKSGYLLNADPKQQFFAQFFGVCAGSLFVVPAFRLLVPTAADIGTDKWPAPGALQWQSVALMLSNGFHSIHPTARWAILVGGIVGIVLVLLEKYFPKYKAYIPLASGLGLGFTIPATTGISEFAGALIALYLVRRMPKIAERATLPVASGFIAGDSLMGVLIAALVVLGYLNP